MAPPFVSKAWDSVKAPHYKGYSYSAIIGRGLPLDKSHRGEIPGAGPPPGRDVAAGCGQLVANHAGAGGLEMPQEPLAKVSFPVILRKRSDRRISITY
jgi:hypothetical protein